MDIIGICEIFKCNRDNRLNFPGFHELISNTRQDSTRGGVGMFINENINYKKEMILAFSYLTSLTHCLSKLIKHLK